MNRSHLQRANVIEACIKAAEENIECYEKLGKAKELIIRTRAVEDPTIHVSGENQRAIIEILKLDQQRVINRNLTELEKL